MSAAPTLAMLAACTNQPYTIPFSGDVSFVHVEDAAIRFIAAAATSYNGAHVFDLNGTPAHITEIVELIKNHRPDAQISFTGDPMPFPANPEDGDLDSLLKTTACRPIRQGITDTFNSFDQAHARGADLAGLLQTILGRNP
jgi:nucleoside-diphosphate-sugar epimerase